MRYGKRQKIRVIKPDIITGAFRTYGKCGVIVGLHQFSENVYSVKMENGNYWQFAESDVQLASDPWPIPTMGLPDDPAPSAAGGLPGATSMRTFDTGATRSSDAGKIDPEGFLSPLVIERYCQYLNKHRVQADGKLRDADNWQKGMGKSTYMKSAWRHFLDMWKTHRTTGPVEREVFEDSMMAVLFNVMGYAHECLKEQK